MDPAALQGLAEIIVPSISILVFGGFALACFPSIRGALVERLRLRSMRHADATEVTATLNALRGEVYALRTELAEMRRVVGPGPTGGPALSPGR